MKLKYGSPVSHIDDLKIVLDTFLPGSEILMDGHGGIIIDTKCDITNDDYLNDRDVDDVIPALNELYALEQHTEPQ